MKIKFFVATDLEKIDDEFEIFFKDKKKADIKSVSLSTGKIINKLKQELVLVVVYSE